MEVTYAFIEANEFYTFFRANRKKAFSNDFDIDIEKVLSEEEKEQRAQHRKAFEKRHSYYLVATVENQIIGWSFGRQKSGEEYYMVNSAVFEAYRRQGIYTELMTRSMQLITELGFQRVYSKHKMSNNSILIPKLKFGFTITGFEVNDVFGNLVELSYYTNASRRALLEVRIGTKAPDAAYLKRRL